MFRAYFTNKWVLGGFCFLIVFGIACYFWYQQELAPYKKQAAETEEMLRQSERAKKAETAREVREADPAVSDVPVGSTTLTTETLVPEATVGTENTETIPAHVKTGPPTETTETAEVPVSPYGLGPYPEVPEDYTGNVLWNEPEVPAHFSNEILKSIELINRVLVKLWTEGEKNFRGGSTYNGKVYPHYHNTVYVRFREYELPDGTTKRYPARVKSGPQVVYSREDLLNPPPHLRVLDLDSSGIDPYQFLDLP